MKKKYTAPATFSVEFHATNMIALSLNDDQITSGNQSEYEQNVKGQSSPRYNVWDDDWSAQ